MEEQGKVGGHASDDYVSKREHRKGKMDRLRGVCRFAGLSEG